jgi:hypothetical protein
MVESVVRHSKIGWSMSALGQKQTRTPQTLMSAFTPKADTVAVYNLRSLICGLKLKRLVGRRVKEFVHLHAAR